MLLIFSQDRQGLFFAINFVFFDIFHETLNEDRLIFWEYKLEWNAVLTMCEWYFFLRQVALTKIEIQVFKSKLKLSFSLKTNATFKRTCNYYIRINYIAQNLL